MEDFGKEFFGTDESGYHESSYSGTLLFMGHLHSGDRKFGPGKIFIYITFVFVNSILTGHLYPGERDSFSGSRNFGQC